MYFKLEYLNFLIQFFINIYVYIWRALFFNIILQFKKKKSKRHIYVTTTKFIHTCFFIITPRPSSINDFFTTNYHPLDLVHLIFVPYPLLVCCSRVANI